MAWTKQQENAIKIRNSSVIVSAAAGSGKTAVLTERLGQLISDEETQIRADRIIVVTFTNDAASELRKRLDSKLHEMISNNPTSRYLLKQQTLLQNARISTINAFCFDLLRDNITEQGITSGFTVLDESENNIIMAQAMDELINYYCSEEYYKISFMYDKFCIKTDEKLVEVINLADRYLSSYAMRDKWIEIAVKSFDTDPWKSVYYKKSSETAAANLKKALKLAESRLEMSEEIFDDMRAPNAVKYCTQIKEDIDHVKKATDLFESENAPDMAKIEALKKLGRTVPVRRTENVDPFALENCNAKRKIISGIISETLQSFDNFEEDFLENKKTTEILAEMLMKYHSIIWEKKCEKNAISFDDGERLTLELLADFDDDGNIIQTETARKIAEFYDIIMVDEYQDSNNKEDLIFKLISKKYHHSGADRIPMYGKNAFLVGDVKQSIYKFRLANPRNFIDTLKNSEPYSEEKAADNYSVFLNKNFRSSGQVIDFVNYIFSQIMSEDCGDIEYNSDEQLYFGTLEYEKFSDSPEFKTNIAFINSEQDDEGGDEESKSASFKTNYEAVYTAGKIYSMLQAGTPVITKDGGKRPCEPSDFCILIRKNKFAKDYIRELNKIGIEAKGEEEKGYLSSREITILLDLLRIIDNPLLDVPVAAVMMSPMYMFEFEEIAYIKTFGKSIHIFTILNNIVSNKYGSSVDLLFADRCRKFLDDLSKFRLSAVTMTVGELINEIYDDTDFISVMQLYTDGEKKRANLRALVQYAKNYEKSYSYEGSGGLSGFIRYIDRIIENGTDLPQSKISSSTGNYVSVKTIHKSKGLEYPFIFLVETDSKIRKDTPPVICSDDGRIGYVLYDQKLVRRYRTIAYNQLTNENYQNSLSEEMRLLYVALTRAKQKLFINLRYSERKINHLDKLLKSYYFEDESIHKLASYAKSHADWIWMSLFEHSRFAEIAENIGFETELDFPAPRTKSELFEIEYPEYTGSINPNEVDNRRSEALPDAELCRELNRIISYNYDTLLANTPAKMSVTQIAKKMSDDIDNFDFKLKRPKFINENTELTGAERGTAIHTFFQYCDFDNAQNDFDNEIRRMIEKGYLSKQQADSIDRNNAAAFFRSGLFSRITHSPTVYREKKFMAAIADLNADNSNLNAIKESDGMIKGIIDLAFEENGSMVIVDYKSDRNASENMLKERYKMQLKLYKSALELTTGMTVSELYLYSFELRREIKIEI